MADILFILFIFAKSNSTAFTIPEMGRERKASLSFWTTFAS